jgi:hypothetical protein
VLAAVMANFGAEGVLAICFAIATVALAATIALARSSPQMR